MKKQRSNVLLVLASSLALVLTAGSSAFAAFGVSSSNGSFVVDTGANLVFSVNQTNGDVVSMKYKGVEYEGGTNRHSHIASGFGTATVSAQTIGDAIIITDIGMIGTTTCTQYYIARKGYDNIYMGTYVNGPTGELRWIGYTNTPITWRPQGMASRLPDDAPNFTVIESADTFMNADGTTFSKYMSSQMAKDLNIHGTHGNTFGLYMAYDNRESSSGGPFYRDIQTGDGIVYNYMMSGHHQLEPERVNVLHGPYALMFVNSTTVPTAQPDYSFITGLGLKGYVPDSARGRVILNGLSGMDSAYPYYMGFANTTAQYWGSLSSTGSGGCWGMKPGSYTMTIYKNQLAVWTSSVTVPVGPLTLHTITLTGDPSTTPVLWRIGNWDGTPLEFQYGVQQQDGYPDITSMHPSDTREVWSAKTFTVGSSALSTGFPAIQWQDVNDATTIKFNLTASQVAAHTIRIGITDAYGGARPGISVNAWNSAIPAIVAQPDGRCFTIGTYRGYNATFTFNVPASAFVVGQNTLKISAISGSGGSGYLSPSIAYDCVELQ